jgi:hypothetical protein
LISVQLQRPRLITDLRAVADASRRRVDMETFPTPTSLSSMIISAAFAA